MKYLIHWKSFFGITLTRYTKLWTEQINKCLLQEASLNNIAHESLYKNVLGGLNTRFYKVIVTFFYPLVKVV